MIEIYTREKKNEHPKKIIFWWVFSKIFFKKWKSPMVTGGGRAIYEEPQIECGTEMNAEHGGISYPCLASSFNNDNSC